MSWLRTRMVLEATAPSRDRSPPSCPRLSRLPSPSSQELRTSPLGWLLYGSPCTGPCNSGRCPTTTTTTRSPSPPASVRWCTGELLDRAEGARHSRSVDSGLLLPPWVPPGLWEVTSVACQGCPKGLQNCGRPGAGARPGILPAGASAPFFFFRSSFPSLLTLK